MLLLEDSESIGGECIVDVVPGGTELEPQVKMSWQATYTVRRGRKRWCHKL
jgi:hypothetical protein